MPTSAFSFHDWSKREGFRYPPHAFPMLARVGSPAEAYFLRCFMESPSTLYGGRDVAHCRGAAVRVQVRCTPYRIDVVAERGRVQLAIEIDGFAFHNATKAQVAADYYRARRLLRAGYVVIRFTASEAMSRPDDCWRDVFAVLNTRCSVERSA